MEYAVSSYCIYEDGGAAMQYLVSLLRKLEDGGILV